MSELDEVKTVEVQLSIRGKKIVAYPRGVPTRACAGRRGIRQAHAPIRGGSVCDDRLKPIWQQIGKPGDAELDRVLSSGRVVFSRIFHLFRTAGSNPA